MTSFQMTEMIIEATACSRRRNYVTLFLRFIISHARTHAVENSELNLRTDFFRPLARPESERDSRSGFLLSSFFSAFYPARGRPDSGIWWISAVVWGVVEQSDGVEGRETGWRTRYR